MKNLFNYFIKDDIGEPPWEYDFLYNLPDSEYPKYLAKIFKYKTGENLPLKYDFKNKSWIIDKKRCKTFNQKIQWIKLYGVTDLMRKCTDKVAVRDYVAEKIGSEYLKPVLQVIGDCHCERKRSNPADFKINNNNIGWTATDYRPRSDRQLNNVSTYFDQIDFDKLPNAFVIKCNHGCKWQYIIKNKKDVLNTKPVVDLIRKNMTGWLEQEYCFWQGFELQYKGIIPQLFIEKLLREHINIPCTQLQVYCFNGNPQIIVKFFDNDKMSIFNDEFGNLDNIFNFPEQILKISIDYNIKQSILLSCKLAAAFKFVRIDWIIYKNRLYFEEMTFTPYSGYINFDKGMNIQIGNMLSNDYKKQGDNNGI